MRQFAVACGILTICSCSRGDSEEVEKLKRELDAAFDAMIEELGVRQLEAVTHREHKVRKSSDGTGYDFYCTARELNSRNPAGPRAFVGDGPGVGPRINFALTLRSQAGGWKASTVEIMVAEEK